MIYMLMVELHLTRWLLSWIKILEGLVGVITLGMWELDLGWDLRKHELFLILDIQRERNKLL